MQTLATPATPVSRNDDEVISGFKAIDLKPIIFKLMDQVEGEGWSLEKATRHVEEFKFFYYMHWRFPNQTFVPTKPIDTVWHALIQDTRLYRLLCQKHLGYFLDHFPYLGTRGAADEKLLALKFAETKLVFAEHFAAFFSNNEGPIMFKAAGCSGCGGHCGVCSGDISLPSEESIYDLDSLYAVRPTV